MIKYAIPFLTAFSLSMLFICFFLLFFKGKDWGNRQDGRHIHVDKKILRLGGAAIILSFNLAILFSGDLFISRELIGVMLASLIILGVGLWDDMRELSWKIQLAFQMLAASLVFLFGVRIYYLTNPFLKEIIYLDTGVGVFISFFIALFWIVLFMNAMNWLDGLDGLSGGTTLIAALTIFFLSLKAEVNQPPVAIITMILAGSISAFLIFNFNPAKIMAGTSGSMFMGFSLAILAIFSGTKIATTLLIFSVPIVDFLWVVWERLREGKSIFIPDNKHLHHKLLSLGWSPRKINLSLYSITTFIAVIALNTRALGKGITLILTVVVLIIVLLTLNKMTSKQAESLN